MNEESEYDHCDKIVAISDIEGNFKQFYKLLIKSKVIDAKLNWIFGNGHLVILGDCFDRGEHVIECLWLIYYLEEKAKKKSGHVHFILGNHEIMNINGDWRYVHPKYSQHKNPSKPHTALYSGNFELWRWLSTKNIVEKIGKILFVHGGIADELLKLNYSVSEINNYVRPYYSQSTQSYEDPLLRVVFNSDKSPIWFRGYYQAPPNEELINKTLLYFSVDTIITGHTIVDKITPFFNGKVINIDSNYAIENSQALLIKRNRFYRIFATGKKERII